jgi:transposase InsO family protein
MQMLAEEYPVTQICEVWGSARSSYYRRQAPTDEAALHEAIERLAGQWPTDGDRRSTQQLRREGWRVNHKHVERLMRAAGLHVHWKAKRRTTTDNAHPFPRYLNLVEQLEIVRTSAGLGLG